MNRYYEIEAIVCKNIEEHCYGNKKRQGYRHLFGVSTLCKLWHEDLDHELCALMGLMHDYSIYRYNNSFNHAIFSSEAAKKILVESSLFSDEEIDIVVEAIKNHSTKDKRHDRYSELLKLCDVIESYLNEPECAVPEDRLYYLDLARQKQLL